MKSLVAALCMTALLLFAIWRATDHAEKDAALLEAQTLLASKDSALVVAKELTDSANARLERADAKATVVTRLVTKTDTLRVVADSLASVEHWKPAYEARTLEADTLRVALRVSQSEVADVRTAFAFAEARRVGDSTRIASLEYSLAQVVRVAKPKLLDRVGLSVGYGATITGGAIRTGPSVVASVRVYP